MSHSRFLQLNDSQTVTLIKYNENNNIEVLLEDTFYFKNKIYNVFISNEEMKAISILFEREELQETSLFFDFLFETFTNPNKDMFYRLHIFYEHDLISFYIGIRNKYPISGYIRETYKFKLKEKVF